MPRSRCRGLQGGARVSSECNNFFADQQPILDQNIACILLGKLAVEVTLGVASLLPLREVNYSKALLSIAVFAFANKGVINDCVFMQAIMRTNTRFGKDLFCLNKRVV